MFVQRLYELRKRLGPSEVPPAYYKKQSVQWIIEIDKEGTFQGFSSLDKKKQLTTPYISRSGKIPPPFLLADKVEYLLGIRASDNWYRLPLEKREIEEDKIAHKHQDYLELQKDFFDSYEEDEPTLSAVQKFYTEGQARLATEELYRKTQTHNDTPPEYKVKDGDLFVFRVEQKEHPHDHPYVQKYWEDLQDRKAEESAKKESECILTGTECKIAKVHSSEFLIGPERTKLISGNSPAFLSYGLQKSEIAPISVQAARQYGESLQYLLRNPQNHLRVGDVTYVFWTQKKSVSNVFMQLNAPEPEHIQKLLKSPLTGKQIQHVDTNAFYAASLSSQKARLAVRDYLETTLHNAEEQITNWFESQHIVSHDGTLNRFASLSALAHGTLRSTGNNQWSQLAPSSISSLFRRALKGTPLPLYLLMKILQRLRAESGHVTHPRAALLKIILNDNATHSAHSNQAVNKEVIVTQSLNPNEHNPGYLCGRLFAVLERTQTTALGSIQSTIADRFFGTASSAPASVFGRLLRGNQAHMQKLRKTNEGAYKAIQKEMESILEPLQGFPTTLSLHNQGLFAIGYYHQKAQDRHARIAAAEKKKNTHSEESK